mmetsp:Transcript_5738/g.14929  ORF Transcript_5738/g.14929 Transcript_5738/m.14929 type:complete len:245 (-) Transcript_5738:1747-2481(-)
MGEEGGPPPPRRERSRRRWGHQVGRLAGGGSGRAAHVGRHARHQLEVHRRELERHLAALNALLVHGGDARDLRRARKDQLRALALIVDNVAVVDHLEVEELAHERGAVQVLARDRVVVEREVEQVLQVEELFELEQLGDPIRPEEQGLQLRQRRKVRERTQADFLHAELAQRGERRERGGLEPLDLVAIEHELPQLREVVQAVDTLQLVALQVEHLELLQRAKAQRAEVGQLVVAKLEHLEGCE